MLISNPLKKLQKNAPEKSYTQSNFRFISKLAKMGFFSHFFANFFLRERFFLFFSTESRSAYNSAFFDTSVDFFKQKLKNLHFFCFPLFQLERLSDYSQLFRAKLFQNLVRVNLYVEKYSKSSKNQQKI